jgi:hypothetical protein
MAMETIFLPSRPLRNLGGLAKLILGAPWLLVGAFALWRARAAPPPWRGCALSVLLALALQQLFWLSFSDYYKSPLRYELPLLMVAAVALPALADGLAARWPQRGLGYATVALAALGVASFLSGSNDFYWPFVNDPEDPMYPGRITFAGWYAQALPFHRQPDYLFRADGFDATYSYPQTPVGATQLGVLLVLVAGGAAMVARSWWQARAAERSADPGPGTARFASPR